VQTMALESIRQAVHRHKAQAGFAIVADPLTGEILAVANVDARPKPNLLKHWSLSQRLRPASVIKALVISSAIEKGVTKPDEVIDCERSHFVLEGTLYQDWKPFGKLTTTEALALSSDIGSIKIALRLGKENIENSYTDWGIGP